MNIKRVYAGAGILALAAGLSLSACGGTPAAIVTQAAPITINNNNAPASTPTQTVYQPVYQPAPVATQADSWSVVVAYVNDVNDGDSTDAWNLFGPAEQATWNSSYSTFAAWVGQTVVSNTSEVSESGDTMTITFNLSNSAGTNVPYTATFVVNNGIIISCASSQN